MTTTIKKSPGPLDPHELEKAERLWGVTLPSDYRKFLLAYNGGAPDPDAFPIYNNPSGPYGLLRRFLSIKPGHVYDLQRYYDEYKDRIPAGFLPVACDPGGNLVCLAVAGENTGKVYFWEHEEEAASGELPGYDNVYWVADSFAELLESLTIPA